MAGGKPSSFLSKWRKWPVGAPQPGSISNNGLGLRNQPNPFSKSTVISWQQVTDDQVKIKVFDFMGKEVIALIDAHMTSGEHQVTFNATVLPAGVYYYQLQVNANVETKKMIVYK